MDSVKLAAEGFYKALNALFVGEMTPMKEVWSHKDDVTYLGPHGGILVGWDHVCAAFQKQADRLLGGEIQSEDMYVFVHGDIAFTQNYEVGRNIVDGKEVTVKIRALNLFRKEEGVWKMISHQTDELPYL